MNNPFFHSFLWAFAVIFTVPCPPFVLSSDALPQRQQQLAERYAQLEHVLQRLAEASATRSPKNAGLLKKTLDGSKNKLLASRLSKIAEVLERSRFTDAVSEQETVEKDLLELLQILESADREQRRDNEKERLKQLLHALDTITQQERLLKDKTQQVPKDAAEKLRNETLRKEQEQIRLKTQTLKDQLQAEAANDAAVDKETQTPSPVGEAAKKMQQAEEKLQKPDKNGAVEAQEDAVAELQKAKAELEKKLRQMREEELIADLEKLEVRFKRMLQVEQGIRSQTDKIAAQPPSRQKKIEADRLASDQQSNISEAEAALIMLREHGTARAAAEALEQARFDMTEIQHRLKETQLDYVTIQIEDSVIESLKELIDAVQSAKEEAAKRQDAQNAAGKSASAAEDEPLIQLLSELRMIRTMQRRVNDRTARCNAEIEKLRQIPNADFGILQKQVEELARQQNRISRILHDLKIGKAE